MKKNSDILFMQAALNEAKKAFKLNEVPVGCVVVKNDKIISKAHNKRESKKNVLAHAEILAIQKAAKKMKTWRLNGCDVYITLEPCLMCAGMLLQSQVRRIIYGALEPKFGVHQSILNVFDYPFNHKIEVIGGVLEEESATLMKSFFQKLREPKS